MRGVRLLTILLPLLVLLGLVACDRGRQLEVTRVVTITETGATRLPGRVYQARTDTTILWLGPERARRDRGLATFLVDGSNNIVTHVDHAQRTWTRASSEALSEALALLAADTVQAADRRTHNLQSLLKVSARVTDMNEARTIDGYPCRRWVVEQQFGDDQHITTEIWLTDAIAVDAGLLQRVASPSLAAVPGGEQALAELSRLQGIPVRSASLRRLMGGDSRSESRLVKVETVQVPADFFMPPEDYTGIGPDSQ